MPNRSKNECSKSVDKYQITTENLIKRRQTRSDVYKILTHTKTIVRDLQSMCKLETTERSLKKYG